MTVIGFTGTQDGMTPEQEQAAATIIVNEAAILHHGDCIGADAQAHSWAIYACVDVVIHPPTDQRKRAFCAAVKDSDRVIVMPERPYLDRNRDIVDACSRLIACPRLFVEELRSGTWATIRYARRQSRPVTIIWPDGRLEES